MGGVTVRGRRPAGDGGSGERSYAQDWLRISCMSASPAKRRYNDWRERDEGDSNGKGVR